MLKKNVKKKVEIGLFQEKNKVYSSSVHSGVDYWLAVLISCLTKVRTFTNITLANAQLLLFYISFTSNKKFEYKEERIHKHIDIFKENMEASI